MELLLVLLAAALVLVPATLTFVGMRTRGHRAAAAVIGGAAFPVTWAVWYVVDEHPYVKRTDQAPARRVMTPG